MQRFSSRIKRFLIRWYYWILDYIYVGFWQALGFIRHGDAKIYLKPAKVLHKTPVILIPGIYERWEFMKPIANILFNAGYVVHVVEGIGYNRGTVEEAAQKVRHYIAENHLTNCIIVAHSKGGLIGKYLLLHHNKRNVFNGMVAINTPFSGSKYAYLLPLPSLRIFTPNSSLLQQLAVNEVINNRIVSIFGLFDPHIPKGSFLKGATNVRLHTYGHFRTINDKRVHKAILDGLKELSKSKI